MTRRATVKLIVQIVSYAATLNLVVISRVVALDQWSGIVGQWALMIAVVIGLQLVWMVGAQVIDDTRRLMEEKRNEQLPEDT